MHEWIDGSKQKKRAIDDSEVRKFLGDRRAKGEEITLITTDYGSWKQVRVDGLPVVYVQEVLRDYVRKQN